MKKTIPVMVFIFFIGKSYSQANKGENLAHQFGDRMKDSLMLTNQQTTDIFNVNMYLHGQKQLMRQQIADFDSLQIKIQKVESMRDSLYKKILNPDQYQLYKERKKNLIAASQN